MRRSIISSILSDSSPIFLPATVKIAQYHFSLSFLRQMEGTVTGGNGTVDVTVPITPEADAGAGAGAGTGTGTEGQMGYILDENGNPVQKPIGAESTMYTVQSGDTLWKIARQVYGKGWQWRKIYQANTDTLTSPGELHVGQNIVIPEK